MSKDDGDIVATNGPEPIEGAVIAGEFRIRASLMGVDLGWWKDDGATEYWISATHNRAEAIIWTLVASGGHTYLKKSTNNYLSYRSNKVIYYEGLKIRQWTTAAAWKRDGDFLRCVNNGNLVGYDGGMFYCNNQNIVKVDFVPVKPDAS